MQVHNSLADHMAFCNLITVTKRLAREIPHTTYIRSRFLLEDKHLLPHDTGRYVFGG